MTKRPKNLFLRYCFCFYLIVFGLFTSQAQKKNRFPKIDFKDSIAAGFPIYDELKIKDKEALIIKIFEYDFLIKGIEEKYFVFLNNGKVNLYSLKKSNSFENVVIKKSSIKKADRENFWNFLDSIVTSGDIYLDVEELSKSIYQKDTAIIRGMATMVQKGRTWVLFFKGNKFFSYRVKNPALTKMDKTPGREEKVKFFNLYHQLNFLHTDAWRKSFE